MRRRKAGFIEGFLPGRVLAGGRAEVGEAVGVVAEGESGRAHAEARERGRGELRAGGPAKGPRVHPAMRVRVQGRIRLARGGVIVNAAARVVVRDLVEREVEDGQDDDADEIGGDRRGPGGSVLENQCARPRPGPNLTRRAAVVTSRGGSAGSDG